MSALARHLVDFVAARDPHTAMEALVELGGGAVAELLSERDAADIAALVDRFATDDAVVVLKLLPEPLMQRVRAALRQHQHIDAVLEHSAQTAGRMMNPSLFALRRPPPPVKRSRHSSIRWSRDDLLRLCH